jgi:hypothetical protein
VISVLQEDSPKKSIEQELCAGVFTRIPESWEMLRGFRHHSEVNLVPGGKRDA